MKTLFGEIPDRVFLFVLWPSQINSGQENQKVFNRLFSLIPISEISFLFVYILYFATKPDNPNR